MFLGIIIQASENNFHNMQVEFEACYKIPMVAP